MLQSAVTLAKTSKHGGDDHLNISTGAIYSVRDSQSSNQDREKTTKPKKICPQRKLVTSCLKIALQNPTRMKSSENLPNFVIAKER